MSVFLSAFAGVGAQFFDNNGNILSGGKIFTYAAGTTTPQATYTSSSGASPNTNPIILNAAGRTAQPIWLTAGVAYKFVLKTAQDVTIGTYDNVSGVNDFSVQGIAWSDISGAPTTLSGYGITDAYTKTAADAKFAPIANPTKWVVLEDQMVSLFGQMTLLPAGTVVSAASYGPAGLRRIMEQGVVLEPVA